MRKNTIYSAIPDFLKDFRCYDGRNGLPEADWESSPHTPELSSEKVHFWRVHVPDHLSSTADLIGLLSPDERRKAQNYHFAVDSDCFIVRRGALRSVLGTYLRISPEQIDFSYNSHGKPSLTPETDVSVSFNSSFSKGVQLIAVGCGERICINVEFVDEAFPFFDVADQFFTQAETSSMRMLPDQLHASAFYTFWTQEAYAKATGKGLTQLLPEIQLREDKDTRRLLTASSSFEAEGLFVKTFTPQTNYLASIVFEQQICEVRYLQWSVDQGRIVS